MRRLLCLLVLPLVLALAHVTSAAAVTANATAALSALTDVRRASDHRYHMQDDTGTLVGVLNATQRTDGLLVGTYFAAVQQSATLFESYVGTSPDGLNWKQACSLGQHNTMPAIYRLPDGGSLIAYEHQYPDMRIETWISWFPNDAALLSCAPARTRALPRQLSKGAEGTPNFQSVIWNGTPESSTIVLGTHYFKDFLVDREAEGVLFGFDRWVMRDRPDLNDRFAAMNLGGNFGGRTNLFYNGTPLTIYEAQGTRGDFPSWRLYLRDPADGDIVPFGPRTHLGSEGFGNPWVTEFVSGGRRKLLLTAFVFGGKGGEGGPLGWIVDVPDVPDRTIPAEWTDTSWAQKALEPPVCSVRVGQSVRLVRSGLRVRVRSDRRERLRVSVTTSRGAATKGKVPRTAGGRSYTPTTDRWRTITVPVSAAVRKAHRGRRLSVSISASGCSDAFSQVSVTF